METEQNFIEDNDRMDELDLEVGKEEVERPLNVELVFGSNEPNDGKVLCVNCGKKSHLQKTCKNKDTN